MPMRPCRQCAENRWTFNYVEGMVYATCQSCGNEVSWEARKPARHHASPPVTIVGERYNPKPDDGKPPWE